MGLSYVCEWKMCRLGNAILMVPFSSLLEDFNGDPHGISVFFLKPYPHRLSLCFSLHNVGCTSQLPLVIYRIVYVLCLQYTTQILIMLIMQKYNWVLFSPCYKSIIIIIERRRKKKTNLGWNGFFFTFFIWGGEWGLWKLALDCLNLEF